MNQNVSHFSDSIFDFVACDLVNTGMSGSKVDAEEYSYQCSGEQRKALSFVASSASTCDWNNTVFTLYHKPQSHKQNWMKCLRLCCLIFKKS